MIKPSFNRTLISWRRAHFLLRAIDSPNPKVRQKANEKLCQLFDNIPFPLYADALAHRLVLPSTNLQSGKSNYEFLGLSKPAAQHNPDMAWFDTHAKSMQSKAHVASLYWRIGEAIQHAYDNQQFVVFDTLTYDRSRFRPHDDHVKSYLKLMNPDHYVLVRETQNHLHYHVLLIYNQLHEKYRLDPNSGQSGSRREIQSFKVNWRYGYSSPIAWRIGTGDAWDRCGHAWPTLKDKKTPIPAVNPQQSGGYLCKYLTKEKSSPGRAVMISKGIGLNRLNNCIASIPTALLRPLTQMALWPQHLRQNLPSDLLQRKSNTERLKRIYNYNPNLILMMSRSNISLYSDLSVPASNQTLNTLQVSEAFAKLTSPVVPYARMIRAYDAISHLQHSPISSMGSRGTITNAQIR